MGSDSAHKLGYMCLLSFGMISWSSSGEHRPIASPVSPALDDTDDFRNSIIDSVSVTDVTRRAGHHHRLASLSRISGKVWSRMSLPMPAREYHVHLLVSALAVARQRNSLLSA